MYTSSLECTEIREISNFQWVKQGGVMSPLLFNVYMQYLIETLERRGLIIIIIFFLKSNIHKSSIDRLSYG